MNQEPPTDSGVSKSTSQYSWVILVLVLCAVVIYFGFWATTPFNIAFKADAGFRRAKKNIDPKQLQVWAIQEISKHPLTNDTQWLRDIPESEIPSQCKIFTLFVAAAAVLRNDSGEIPYVKIFGVGASFIGFLQSGQQIFRSNRTETFYKTIEWAKAFIIDAKAID